MASSGADVVSWVQAAVREALERQHVLSDKYRMVVAVSGGADSLCLLDALVAVVPNAGERLVVGHVDHRLRPESGDDAAHVRAISADLGILCDVLVADVPRLMSDERLGMEEAARLARYRSLARLAGQHATDVVLTGHTRDDSVETVVLHLLRGSGARGLSGIAESERFAASRLGLSQDGPVALRVVRPLLCASRADTMSYCGARCIDWVTDASNADPTFSRNRVRAHLLPVLRTYNPSIDRALTRMAQVFRDEDEWLLDESVKRWATLRVDPAVGELLSLEGWQREPLPMQRRLVRLIGLALGADELGFEAVERALVVGHNDGPRRAELGHGLAVERRQDTLIFQRNQREDQHA
jgi:tRNA(Ile)-lysidine synthetase-like protein